MSHCIQSRLDVTDYYPDMIIGQTILHPKNSGKNLDYEQDETEDVAYL